MEKRIQKILSSHDIKISKTYEFWQLRNSNVRPFLSRFQGVYVSKTLGSSSQWAYQWGYQNNVDSKPRLKSKFWYWDSDICLFPISVENIVSIWSMVWAFYRTAHSRFNLSYETIRWWCHMISGTSRNCGIPFRTINEALKILNHPH